MAISTQPKEHYSQHGYAVFHDQAFSALLSDFQAEHRNILKNQSPDQKNCYFSTQTIKQLCLNKGEKNFRLFLTGTPFRVPLNIKE